MTKKHELTTAEAFYAEAHREKLTPQEIAAAIGVSPRAVEAHLKKAPAPRKCHFMKEGAMKAVDFTMNGKAYRLLEPTEGQLREARRRYFDAQAAAVERGLPSREEAHRRALRDDDWGPWLHSAGGEAELAGLDARGDFLLAALVADAKTGEGVFRDEEDLRRRRNEPVTVGAWRGLAEMTCRRR